MITLLKNEIKKLFSRKKTFVVLIAFAALVALICYSTYRSAVNYRKYSNPEFQKQNIQAEINDMKRAEANVTSQDEKNRIDQQIQSMQQELNRLDTEISSKGGDWRESLKTQIEQIKQAMADSDDPNNKGGLDKEQLRIQLIKAEYELKNNIKPENMGDVTATACMNSLFEVLGAIFLIVGIMVFAADMVSGEFTPPTMKVLLTQPVTRGKILLSKFIAVTISVIVLIIGVQLVSYLIMGLAFSFGNSMFPVAVGTKYALSAHSFTNGVPDLVAVYGSSYIIPMWKYITYLFLFEALFIVACTAFAFMLSTIFKSSMVSVATGAVVSIALTIFQGLPALQKLLPYVITTYGNFSGVITSNIIMNTRNTNNTPLFSCMVLVGWIVICYAISHIVFTKRDVLI